MAQKQKPNQVCGDCIHMLACQMWNIGRMANTDADWCTNYETAKDRPAYYLGLADGRKEINDDHGNHEGTGN